MGLFEIWALVFFLPTVSGLVFIIFCVLFPGVLIRKIESLRHRKAMFEFMGWMLVPVINWIILLAFLSMTVHDNIKKRLDLEEN